MAQVLVPGVAQAVLQGTYIGQLWAVVWHFKYDGSTANWSQTEIGTLATQLKNTWQASALPLCATTVKLTQVTTTDIGSTTPVVGIDTTVLTGTGTGGNSENASLCTLISFKIPVRYKGGHPRTYLPWGLFSHQLNEFQWTPAYLTLANNAIVAMINSVRSVLPPRGSSQVSQVVPRYNYTVVNDPVHQKYVRQRDTLKSVDVVQSYATNQTYGVQRRRLHA